MCGAKKGRTVIRDLGDNIKYAICWPCLDPDLNKLATKGTDTTKKNLMLIWNYMLNLSF